MYKLDATTSDTTVHMILAMLLAATNSDLLPLAPRLSLVQGILAFPAPFVRRSVISSWAVERTWVDN